MAKKITYRDVVKANFDAGLYREFIAQNYASIFVEGGSYNSYRIARRHCIELSKITNVPVDKIISDVKQDYEILEDEK